MPVPNSELSELSCHRCGYDLRAHPPDGQCPECGTSIAESREVAAIPRRPAWRNSDPRWRRRMLAGAWLLVLIPLLRLLRASDWISNLPVPSIFDWKGPLTFGETFICGWGWGSGVYNPLIFCIGVVLLFSKERGRARNRLDWTRRWGVLCSYIVLLLSAVQVLFISALVVTGIAAVFLSMPMRDEPRITQFFVNVSYRYFHYGPAPKVICEAVLVSFSSIAILLACIPLYDALRSSGPKLLAKILLAPLVSFSLVQLALAARDALYRLGSASPPSIDISKYEVYFSPGVFLERIVRIPLGARPDSSFIAFSTEATKWSIVLGIAIWLSIAQLAAWWHRSKTRPKNPV